MSFPHHTSGPVDDGDDVGNFSEYYSDMGCIIDDQLWTPGELEGARGPVRLGPAAPLPPASPRTSRP